MQLNLSQLENAFELRERLPRPNWQLIWENIPPDLPIDQMNSLFNSIVIQWLKALISHLPSGYTIDESDNFFVLSCESPDQRKIIVTESERVLREIISILGDLGSDEGYGKHLILFFQNRNQFIDYIADFFPDGSYVAVGGVMIRDGFSHIASYGPYDDYGKNTVVHELTHCLLAHLPLPAWVDEGITALVQNQIAGGFEHSPLYGLLTTQKQYWNESNINLFHTGDAFSMSDACQQLAYSLSLTLVRNIFLDFPNTARDFIRTAHYNDSGDTALQTTCGVSLSDRIAQTLGPGNWSPITPLFPPPNSSDPA